MSVIWVLLFGVVAGSCAEWYGQLGAMVASSPEEIWTKMNGATVVANAVEKRDFAHVAAAVVLVGEVVRTGGVIPSEFDPSVVCPLFAELAEPVISDYSDFSHKLSALTTLLPLYVFEDPEVEMASKIFASFPFAEITSACTALPVGIRLRVLREQVVRFATNKLSSPIVTVLPQDGDLETALVELTLSDPIDLAVRPIVAGGEMSVAEWISAVNERLFTEQVWQESEDSPGRFTVVSYLFPAAYVAVGRFLAMAVMNDVPLRLGLDDETLHWLLDPEWDGVDSELSFLADGFHELVPESVLKVLLSVDELRTVVRGPEEASSTGDPVDVEMTNLE